MNNTVVRRGNSEQNKLTNMLTNEQIYKEIDQSEFNFCSSLKFRPPFIHILIIYYSLFYVRKYFYSYPYIHDKNIRQNVR